MSDATSAAAPAADLDPAVADTVRAVVAECLGKDVAQVRLEHNLMQDLGAESLDFLDIVFKLEQSFEIEITRGEMEKAARGDMSDDEFAPGGVVSEAGLLRLRELMPEAAERIKPGLRRVQILGLFAVRTFANMVQAKRRAGAASA